MNWIKKNYDQFLVILFGVTLIGVSVMLFLNAQSFPEKFSEVQSAPAKSRKIPELDRAVIDEAQKKLTQPAKWQSPVHSGLLFTSEQYYVKDGQIRIIDQDKLHVHSRMTGDEAQIPNTFFLTHGLPVLDRSVPFQDPDGDGFPNEDEWLHKTDPNKKESHPPYHTLLFLSKWIKVAFRLKFVVYDGDIKRPEQMTFQINTLDLKNPSEFLKIGETVAGTKFKLMKFEFKEKPNPSTGENEDVSELTVLNAETNEEVVLVLNRVADSPNQFAELDYRWNKNTQQRGQVFAVPKLKEFVLQPVTTERYKLLDVSDDEAVIQPPQGDKVTILPYPKR